MYVLRSISVQSAVVFTLKLNMQLGNEPVLSMLRKSSKSAVPPPLPLLQLLALSIMPWMFIPASRRAKMLFPWLEPSMTSPPPEMPLILQEFEVSMDVKGNKIHSEKLLSCEYSILGIYLPKQCAARTNGKSILSLTDPAWLPRRVFERDSVDGNIVSHGSEHGTDDPVLQLCLHLTS